MARRSQRSESGLERQSAKENEARGPFVAHANELGHVFSGRRRNAEAAEIADNGSDVAHVDDVSRFRRTESTRNRDGRDDSDNRADDVLNAVPARVLRDCFRVRHGAAGLCLWTLSRNWRPKRIKSNLVADEMRQLCNGDEALAEPLQRCPRVLCRGRIGSQQNSLLQVKFRVALIPQFAVHHSQVILHGRVVWFGLDCILK